MVVFSIFFGRLAQDALGRRARTRSSRYAALVPWTLLRQRADAVGQQPASANANLITKVYFPRLVIPLAAVLAGLVDFAIAFVRAARA